MPGAGFGSDSGFPKVRALVMMQLIREIVEVVHGVAAGCELLARAGVYAVAGTLAGWGYESNR
jgi:hypothetical protein